MLLAVDIGNTNTAFGVFDGDTIVDHWRISSDKNKTSDEYGVLLRSLIEMKGLSPDSITGSIISCVVPPLLSSFVETIKHYFSTDPVIIGPGIKTGMPILYKNPQEVGADRIVNGVAAYERFKMSVIVVDFGTATTFDCISAKGEYLGGVISPGLQISSEALFQSASKLPKVEIVRPKSVVGKTTVESIQSGLVYGYAGLVDGLVDRIRKDMGERSEVIATGGLATLIVNETKTVAEVDEFLTLRGLRIIYDRNKA